jgi:hypothetical protein
LMYLLISSEHFPIISFRYSGRFSFVPANFVLNGKPESNYCKLATMVSLSSLT